MEFDYFWCIRVFFLGFFFVAVQIWLSSDIGPHLFEMQIYDRSIRLKKEANLVLAMIFILVIGATIVFFKASSFASDDVDELFSPKEMFFLASNDAKPADKSSMLKSPEILAPLVMVTALRVGDIAVASFLTFMLVRIYRYNLRLSAFYLSRYDAIVMCSDPRFKTIKPEALPILMDANFDFGKDQPSLVANFAQLISALYPPPKDPEKDSREPRR